MTRVTVITAFLNESENLREFRSRVCKVLEELSLDANIILVDDCSSDQSAQIVRKWMAADPRVAYIRLSRNCGSHAAFSAGLNHCEGDCAILLAADLQDPPEAIPQLLLKWREGHDVVWATREGRDGVSWRTKVFSGAYYWLMRRFALPDMPSQGADFLLMDRKVVRAYNAIPEKNTSFLAMILWMGFRQTSIGYIKQARVAGNSKWTLSKKVKCFIDSMVSFSYAPIRLMSCLGIAMSVCGFIYALVVIVGRLTGWVVAGTGFAALMVVLLVGQGGIMVMLGVLGEYVWRTFDEARGRPRYIIEKHLAANANTCGRVEASGKEVPTAADVTPE